MGHEEYPTTIKADIIKHFELPKDYNPKEISWRYVENDQLDETKPLFQINESLTEESNLDRLLDSDEFKTPVSEEEIDAARREVEEESLEEKCGKQKITEESDSEIAAIIDSWEDTPEVPVEESCEGLECESKEECDDCLKEEKEDESEVEEDDDDSEEICFTAEEVKEVATMSRSCCLMAAVRARSPSLSKAAICG